MTINLKFFNYLFVLVCLIMGTGMSMHAEELRNIFTISEGRRKR